MIGIGIRSGKLPLAKNFVIIKISTKVFKSSLIIHKVKYDLGDLSRIVAVPLYVAVY